MQGRAVVALLIGAFLVVAGGGKAFRVIASPLGAFVGLLLGEVLAAPLGLAGREGALGLTLAALLFGPGLRAPAVMAAIALGVPVGLGCGVLVGRPGFLVAFLPAAAIAGGIAGFLHRPLRALVATTAGVALALLGLLRLLQEVPAATELRRAHPGWRGRYICLRRRTAPTRKDTVRCSVS